MSDETIRVMCPNLVCRRVLAVPVTARGRTVRCRGCGANNRIPQKKEPPRQPQPVEDGDGEGAEKIANETKE